MEFSFVPKNLIKAKEEIISKHTGIGEPLQVANDFDFMKMIKRIASLNKKEAENEALILTKRNLEMIARYLPHNYYKVRLENLFLVFGLRCNLNLNWILFYEWQNAYDSQEFNTFLVDFISKNEDFEKIMESNHFSVQKFKDILSAESIPISYGKIALAVGRNSSLKLNDKLEYLGIKESSRLSEDCKYLFFTFCTLNDYLRVGEQEILIRVRKYNDVIRKKFLQNFLTEMSLTHLKCFNRIAEYFLGLTGENHSEKFNTYFYNFNPILIRKYVDWINIYKINKIFGDDERSLFWEQYHHEAVTKYAYSNSVVMEFKNYVAIEFLGQASGPWYIYKKEYFEHNVRRLFKTYGYEAAELKSYLFNNTDYEKNAEVFGNANGIRRVHLPNPGWQRKFNSVLIRNRITERIL